MACDIRVTFHAKGICLPSYEVLSPVSNCRLQLAHAARAVPAREMFTSLEANE